MRGDLVWNICAFVPSKAILTKEVVFHEVVSQRGTTVLLVFMHVLVCSYMHRKGFLVLIRRV